MKKLWMILVPFILLIFLVQPAVAQLTISNMEPVSVGNKRGYMCDIAFDSSYTFGGESLTGTSVGMVHLDRVIAEGKDGYAFEYDRANSKLKVFTKAPPIVYEEKHGSGTSIVLRYPPAWIVNVTDENGYPMRWNATANAGVSLGGHEFALTAAISDGVRSGVTTDLGSETIYVTYATQAWKDLYDLLVFEETINNTSGTSGIFTSGNSVIAVGYFAHTGTGVTNAYPVDWNKTIGATEFAVAPYNATSPYSGFKPPSGSKASYPAVVTYLKAPSVSGGTPWIVDHLVSGVSAVVTASGAAGAWKFDKPLLLWGITGHFPRTGATPFQIGKRDTTAVSPFVRPAWGFFGGAPTNGTNDYEQVWGSSDGGVTPTNCFYISGYPWEIPNLKPLEVVNGSDLSDLTGVKVLVIGD